MRDLEGNPEDAASVSEHAHLEGSRSGEVLGNRPSQGLKYKVQELELCRKLQAPCKVLSSLGHSEI